MRDVFAERGVLSAFFNYGYQAHIELSDFLNPGVFSESFHAALYECLEKLTREDVERVDFHSLLSTAAANDYQDYIEKELPYIQCIADTPISLKEAEKLAVKLYTLYVANELKDKVNEVRDFLNGVSGEEPLEEVLEVAEKIIFDYTYNLLTHNNEPRHIASNITEYLEHASQHRGELIGVDSGFPRYNEAIGGGFRRRTVSLIGARTGVGKSYLANNIGMRVAQNMPVLYLDTEMSSEDHIPRAIASLCGGAVTVTEIENGAFASDRSDIVWKAAEKLRNMDYHHVSVAGLPFNEIIGIMRRWIHKHVKFSGGVTNDCLIILDYVKLMGREDVKVNLAEFQELGFLMTSLHNFTVKYDVPVLAFIQLNRDGINREETDVIAGSDRVLWLTTNFTIFKTKSDEEIARDGVDSGNRKLVVLKARHGVGGGQTAYISVDFDGATGTLREHVGEMVELEGGEINMRGGEENDGPSSN